MVRQKKQQTGSTRPGTAKHDACSVASKEVLLRARVIVACASSSTVVPHMEMTSGPTRMRRCDDEVEPSPAEHLIRSTLVSSKPA